MAPIPSDDESDDIISSVSGSELEQSSAQLNGVLDGHLEDDEEEFHTEDSDASDEIGAEAEEAEDSDLEVSTNAPGVPLLPESLLKHIPQPANPAQSLANVPWDRLTPKQKKTRRNNSRKAKKQEYDRLREDAKGSGVLEAGRAAQKKRGVVLVAKKEKVRSGRVEKKGREKIRLSGRQQMIEQRKRVVGMAAAGEVGRRGKSAKTRSRR